MSFRKPRLWEFEPKYERLRGMFNEEQCDRILEEKDDWNASSDEITIRGDVYRSSDLWWMTPSARKSRWVFDHLRKLVLDYNSAHYQFEIDGSDDLQLTRYGPGQHYQWHADLGSGRTSRRKLSLSVLLSDPGDFKGGDLEFFRSEKKSGIVNLKKGDGVIFPSWLKHRVAPVTEGERYSLVSWWTGPPLR